MPLKVSPRCQRLRQENRLLRRELSRLRQRYAKTVKVKRRLKEERLLAEKALKRVEQVLKARFMGPDVHWVKA